MNWKEVCIAALDGEKMFESSEHRTRFFELLDCYSEYPFFTKGLCKCMYMSAWDEEHFAIMLETLSDMAIGREKDTEDMQFQGDVLAEEQGGSQGYGEAYMYHLSGAFLAGQSERLEGYDKLSEHYRYIVDKTMKASEIIDALKD